ncbi:MAG: hypothetical protein GY737_29320 [Desulfobacteraceae bacterium]|nr:hypothetical protein [Desulfobacteraceae bacterium]
MGTDNAYQFIVDTDMDPFHKIRTNIAWRTVVKIILRELADEGSLTWLPVDDGHGELTYFAVAGGPTAGGGGGFMADDTFELSAIEDNDDDDD